MSRNFGEKGFMSGWSIFLVVFCIIAFGIFWFFERNMINERTKNALPQTELLGNAENSLGDINSIEKDLDIPEISKDF